MSDELKDRRPVAAGFSLREVEKLKGNKAIIGIGSLSLQSARG